ncbi:hypothetical protein [Micromonospora aurantiaca (nom. illeg.)]|uniref:hypothetical protein n=1 Tax=Micromonospora aurantiaca (nom. illeg.) TaxID=47850 RepID=UPI00340FFAC7
MTTLILPYVFINNMASGELVSARAEPDRRGVVGRDGEVRTYGEGRRRAVSQVGRIENLTVRLVQVPGSSKALLEEWEGEHVMYRDDRGRRIVGVYWQLDDREYVADKQRYNVGFVLQGVTWVEAVPA